ncbi:MAG: FecR domain-containing protein [Thermodesulfovibrionales bacterium]|nr:FecR domain-containing protein [Thermodesulfovibrionales bacterium]
MKTIKLIIFATLILLLPVYSFSASHPDSRLDFVNISLIDGDVQIKMEETGEWVPASINMPLKEGDRLWVPDNSKVELRLKEGSYVRLNERSSIEVLTLNRDSYQFYLLSGHAYINFKGARDTVLQMDTPLSTIRAYDYSKFKIDVYNGNTTDISVLTGIVYAESREGTTRVKAGKTLTVREQMYAEISPLGPPDEWELWNKQRDRRLMERRYSEKYLPDELTTYSSDFDDHGEWVNVRPYGYVWRPTIYISAGWAPYRHGRWAWIRGDYVWISYEPWGWAPYHYGRWVFAVSVGWCWTPPARGHVYWGPGFVGWVYTPTYVSWVPLAPEDIYYGYGYYGPNSVNITNVNINVINVKAYKHSRVANAVTIINRNTFVKGKYEEIRIKDNPFLTERIHVGRPLIKHEKETSIPIVKELSVSKAPPKRIVEIQTKELKENRPLIKESRKPVFAPKGEMPVKSLKEPKSGTPFREFDKIPERIPERKGLELPQKPMKQDGAIKKEGIKSPDDSRVKMPERPAQPMKPQKPSEATVMEKQEQKGKQTLERTAQPDDRKTEKKSPKQSPHEDIRGQQPPDEKKGEDIKQRR